MWLLSSDPAQTTKMSWTGWGSAPNIFFKIHETFTDFSFRFPSAIAADNNCTYFDYLPVKEMSRQRISAECYFQTRWSYSQSTGRIPLSLSLVIILSVSLWSSFYLELSPSDNLLISGCWGAFLVGCFRLSLLLVLLVLRYAGMRWQAVATVAFDHHWWFGVGAGWPRPVEEQQDCAAKFMTRLLTSNRYKRKLAKQKIFNAVNNTWWRTRL